MRGIMPVALGCLFVWALHEAQLFPSFPLSDGIDYMVVLPSFRHGCTSRLLRQAVPTPDVRRLSCHQPHATAFRRQIYRRGSRRLTESIKRVP